MDEHEFDKLASLELETIEEAFDDVDPDKCDLVSSAGVIRLGLENGVTVVINSHRAAGQIWMAAVASAWHFDPGADGKWYDSKNGAELRATLRGVLSEQIGIDVSL